MGNRAAVDKWLKQVHADSAEYVDGEAWKAPVDWRRKPWIYSDFDDWRMVAAALQVSTVAALFDGPGSTSVAMPAEHIIKYLIALRGKGLLGVGSESAVFLFCMPIIVAASSST